MNSDKNREIIDELETQRKELLQKRDRTIWIYFSIPILSLILGLATLGPPAGFFIPVFVAVLSIIIYQFNFSRPFSRLRAQAKISLIEEFMKIFHPNLEYKYSEKGNMARKLIPNSGLISADRYYEEDVFTGQKNNIHFYLSEIDLKNEYEDDDRTKTKTIFEGLLFRLKFTDKSFPKAQIYSQPNIFKKWFGSVRKNEEYGFWYDTHHPDAFDDSLRDLFPFIRYLAQKQGDIRIVTNENEIIILLESDMKFMDSPEFSMSRSLRSDEYQSTFAKQLNSLLYIIDTFGEHQADEDIEEQLELRMMQKVEEINRSISS